MAEITIKIDTLQDLNKRLEKLELFKECFENLYGEGLSVIGLHQNSDRAPFDELFLSALEIMESVG